MPKATGRDEGSASSTNNERVGAANKFCAEQNTQTRSLTLLEYQIHGDSKHVESYSSNRLPESISWRVSHSWELISANLEKVGVDFFLRVFGERPDLLELFHFGGISLEDGKLPPALKNHALIVMETLGDCVAGLSTLEELMPKLRAIGQVHGVSGVQEAHYDIMFKHLMDAIAAELDPDEWDGEMRDAWELVYRTLTGVMKNPNDLFQMEPMEGWGLLNAITCAFLTIEAPFRIAGFTARNPFIDSLFNVLVALSTFVSIVDLCSHWISDKLRFRTFSNQSKRSYWRRQVDRMIFPFKFRLTRFLRSLKMERWANWPRIDAMVIVSFFPQYAEHFVRGFQTGTGTRAGVHWTFAFGLLRLGAGIRVLHFIHCAENNTMLKRQLQQDERLMLRVCKLTASMLAVIHVSACLWCIVARIELGPETIDPRPSSFFPNQGILLGGSGILNAYLHAVHWAWVNLAGIGVCESIPVTTLECFTTLFVHICGATLYTITTGNVVAILETMTQEHNRMGADLAELGALMKACHVLPGDQERIFQGYVMHNLKRGGGEEIEGSETFIPTGDLPDAFERLPPHIQHELSSFALAEAIKRRDAAFAHCSKGFLLALVATLQNKTLLLTGDYFAKESDKIAPQVILVVKGRMEVIVNGKCTRTLQRGDIIGKRWLLRQSRSREASSQANGSSSTDFAFDSQESLRAHSSCSLITGLSDYKEVQFLRTRYEADFRLLQAARERVHAIRERHHEGE